MPCTALRTSHIGMLRQKHPSAPTVHFKVKKKYQTAKKPCCIFINIYASGFLLCFFTCMFLNKIWKQKNLSPGHFFFFFFKPMNWFSCVISSSRAHLQAAAFRFGFFFFIFPLSKHKYSRHLLKDSPVSPHFWQNLF